MGKLAAVGWLLAIAIGGASFLGYQWLLEERQAVLETQAAEYEAKLTKLRADADAQLATFKDEATANQQVMQTELDIAKLPDLPLKFAFRKGQVLYVESEADETFNCKVKLTRPGSGAAVVLDFSVNSRAFKDLAAMGQWMFARGDQIEFVKPGYKTWKGEFP